MTETVVDFVTEIFSRSPNLGFILLLSAWILRAWWFRLVDVGPRRSFPEELLRSFQVTIAPKSTVSLHDLGDVVARFSEGSGSKEQWRVREVYVVYWTLLARAWIVKTTTMLMLFSAFALGVMVIATPTEQVSLSNVVDIGGWLALFGLGVVLVLGLATALSSAHTVPRTVGKDLWKTTVLFFSW